MKRLQNRIAGSRIALPVTALYALIISLANHLIGQSLWIQLLLLAVSTLLMVQLNNINALIRIYSRMVSCSYLVLMSMITFIFPDLQQSLAALCFIVFLQQAVRILNFPKKNGTPQRMYLQRENTLTEADP